MNNKLAVYLGYYLHTKCLVDTGEGDRDDITPPRSINNLLIWSNLNKQKKQGKECPILTGFGEVGVSQRASLMCLSCLLGIRQEDGDSMAFRQNNSKCKVTTRS